MTTTKAIKQAIEAVNFDINDYLVNSYKDICAYEEVKRKLEEALEILKENALV